MGATCCTTNTLEISGVVRNIDPAPYKSSDTGDDATLNEESNAKEPLKEKDPPKEEDQPEEEQRIENSGGTDEETSGNVSTNSETKKRKPGKKKKEDTKTDKEDDKETYTNGPIPNAMGDTTASSASESSGSSDDSTDSGGSKKERKKHKKNHKKKGDELESAHEEEEHGQKDPVANNDTTTNNNEKLSDITITKGHGLTIVLTAPPGEIAELPSKKSRIINELSTDASKENATLGNNNHTESVVTKPSEKYVVPDGVEKPQWLENDDAFFNSLGAFVSKCNTNLKTAIWKKCFTRQDTTLSQIAVINDITKLISAMVMVYLKVRSKTNVKEKIIRPHVMGCAQFIADAYREIVQKDFVQSKNYFSNMLNQYHAYLQDLQSTKTS